MSRLVQEVCPDTATFNILISGHAKVADVNAALATFERMQGYHIIPDILSYKAVWQAHERLGDVSKAGAWMKRMAADGMTPGLGPHAWMVTNSKGHQAVQWLRQMQTARFLPNELCYSTCIRECGDIGDLQYAQELIDEMEGVSL